MKHALPALLLLLAAQAAAQSFISMGRLFTTPGERVQLDAQRNQAQAAGALTHAGGAQAMLPGASSGPGAPGIPHGMGGAPGMDASASCPPGSAPGCPPGAAATATAGMPGADAGGAPQEPEAEAAPGLRLDGVIKRSNGRPMVIVNGEVQPAPAGGVSRGTVRLQADGRSVLLKPGQRYDPATGVVHEAAR
jgi:hypothetical protein